MSIQLKALGLSLLAVMAVGAFAVVNASATSQPNGHFTSDVLNTTLDVKENPPSGAHTQELGQPGFTPIVCHDASYAASITNASTVNVLTVTPSYKQCLTTNKTTNETTVHTNGCTYTFLQPNKESAKTEHTVKIDCPAGKTIQITHSSCTVTVHPQTVKGIGYTTTSEQAPGSTGGAKHSITVTINTSFPVTRHGGFCTLLATNSTGTLTGAATVFGTNTATGAQVGITATGSVN